MCKIEKQYLFKVYINSDDDFSYKSKWIEDEDEDSIINLTYDFYHREEAVKALIECYNEVHKTFESYKDSLMTDIKIKMKNFSDKLNLLFSKYETLKLNLNNGNQVLSFEVSKLDEERKLILPHDRIMDISLDKYDWEEIEKLNTRHAHDHSIEKWNTIFRLKAKTNTTADIYNQCDWLCVDFGFNTKSELMLIMHPLQTHPYGKEFGLAPSPLSCYIFTESEGFEYFEILTDKTYKEIQKQFISDDI